MEKLKHSEVHPVFITHSDSLPARQQEDTYHPHDWRDQPKSSGNPVKICLYMSHRAWIWNPLYIIHNKPSVLYATSMLAVVSDTAPSIFSGISSKAAVAVVGVISVLVLSGVKLMISIISEEFPWVLLPNTELPILDWVCEPTLIRVVGLVLSKVEGVGVRVRVGLGMRGVGVSVDVGTGVGV